MQCTAILHAWLQAIMWPSAALRPASLLGSLFLCVRARLDCMCATELPCLMPF
jgi:hypothetical protein